MTAMLGDTRVKIALYLLLIFEKLWFRFSSKFRNLYLYLYLYLYIWFIEKKKWNDYSMDVYNTFHFNPEIEFW